MDPQSPAPSSPSPSGSDEKKRSLQDRLKEYGIAGVVSYGIFNTLYYTITFTFIWLCVAQARQKNLFHLLEGYIQCTSHPTQKISNSQILNKKNLAYVIRTNTQVPRGLGLGEAARKFIEVMAITWAGSQVTKLVRAGGALAMAPIVDRVLDGIVARLGLRGKGQAFAVVVACCLALAAALFVTVVLAWS